jgi:hypothetical protein
MSIKQKTIVRGTSLKEVVAAVSETDPAAIEIRDAAPTTVIY